MLFKGDTERGFYRENGCKIKLDFFGKQSNSCENILKLRGYVWLCV